MKRPTLIGVLKVLLPAAAVLVFVFGCPDAGWITGR